MFFIKELLLNPAISIPIILYPSLGTLSISILPIAPINNIVSVGSAFIIALAIATAGKIWPPVPPPAMINRFGILLFIDVPSIHSERCFLLISQHSWPHSVLSRLQGM